MSARADTEANAGVDEPAPRRSPGKKAGKLAAIVCLVYAGIVVVFELMIVATGPLQITDIGVPVLVLTTTSGDGTPIDRVLGRIDSNDQLFVSANHWPRAWLDRALENPRMQRPRFDKHPPEDSSKPPVERGAMRNPVGPEIHL